MNDYNEQQYRDSKLGTAFHKKLKQGVAKDAG